MPAAGEPSARARDDAPAPTVLDALAGVASEVIGVLRALSASQPAARADDAVDVEVVTDLGRLAAHGAAWDRLVLGAPRYRPQASFAYVASYLEHLRRPGQPWACLVATHRGRLDGVLPFLVVPTRAAGVTGVHLDAGPLEADLVVRPGREDAVVPALLAALPRAAPRWVSLRFGELQAASPTVTRARRDPGPVVVDVVGASSRLALPRSYDDYLAGFSSRARGNLRRATRKLLALPGARVELVPAARATDDHVDAFVAVEGTGWKAHHGNAICLRPDLTAYYRAATRRLAAAGALEWALLHAHGRIVAAFLMVRMGRKLALDKIAYDASLAQLAPGNVLMGQVIEHAIASGELDELDFLTDHPWNRRWHAEARPCFDVGFFRPAARALLPWYLPAACRRRIDASPLAPRLDRLRRAAAPPTATPGATPGAAP